MSTPHTPRMNTLNLDELPQAPRRLRLTRQRAIPLTARNLFEAFNAVEQENDIQIGGFHLQYEYPVEPGLSFISERVIELLYDLPSDDDNDEEMYCSGSEFEDEQDEE